MTASPIMAEELDRVVAIEDEIARALPDLDLH